MKVIYSSDLFTYNAKYFQTLSMEKQRSFANSLRSMLKLVHEVAWQFAEKLLYEVAWQFAKKLVHDIVGQAPQCMTLLGNLTIWRAVVD